MMSGCLDRKEVRGAIWGVHSTTDRPASGNTGRLFLAFGGPVCADRISNCPLDRVLTYKNLIYLLNLQFCQLLEEHISSVGGKFQDKFGVNQGSYDQIQAVLTSGKGVKCQFGSYFKFWCKKNYRLGKTGSLNIVYSVKTSCPVVAKESIFETLVKCHERVGHFRV